MSDEVIAKLAAWAGSNDSIRALVLEGSRASRAGTDEWSDYDVNVYVRDTGPFLSSNRWIDTFDEVVVYQKTEFEYRGTTIPTRLVVYRHIPRIDFSFWDVSILCSYDRENLYEPYKNGFRVLADKDGDCKNIPEPRHDGFVIARPTEDEYLKNLFDFYFELHSVIKFLSRKNYWFAKSVEQSAFKRCLFRSVVWREIADHPAKAGVIHGSGKNLENHIDGELAGRLRNCFSGYSPENLRDTARLFDGINRELAGKLGFAYPGERVARMAEEILGKFEMR